jgi:hypothetical protein
MFVTCETCGARYNDATRWTICPHRRLEEPPVDDSAIYGRSRRPPQDQWWFPWGLVAVVFLSAFGICWMFAKIVWDHP